MNEKSFEDAIFEEALPRARHEFGHYFVARELGFKTSGITIAGPAAIAGPGGGAGSTLAEPINDLSDLKTYCERRVKVLMAGILAEAMEDGDEIDHERARLYAETTGANDYAKWREHIHLLRNIIHPQTIRREVVQAELSALSEQLWRETSEILVRHSASIHQISQELAERAMPDSGARPVFGEEELVEHPVIKLAFAG